jgi:hypothetical protein
VGNVFLKRIDIKKSRQIGGIFLLYISITTWVKGIAQTVANQIDAQNGKNDENAGKNPHPP